MKFKKIAALLLSASMLFAGLTACNTNSSSGNNSSTSPNEITGGNTDTGVVNTPDGYGLSESIEDGAILHCFSWSFKAITESMEDIALAGFSAIQTSPVNACYDGGDAGMDLFGAGKWFYHYQPTDWTIGNYQLGTKEEFTEMCSVAESYGIKVIVDVVPNHTTKNEEAISEDFINAVGGRDKLYHSDGLTTISNYNDRGQSTLLAMAGLYDVNTENPAFQDYFIDYLNECIECGADGFRYDTAKHIGLPDDPQDDPSLPNNFWERVTTEINNSGNIFNYGEVLQGEGDRIADYIESIGATTASAYGQYLRGALTGNNLYADGLTNLKAGGSTDVVTWVESHDNYTEDNGSAATISNEDIIIGWSVIAARAEGTPLFFSRPYGATNDNMWGTFNKIGMVGDNLYKHPTVVAVNRFRNAMIGEGENLFNPEGNSSVLFIERGTKGLVIVNNSPRDYEINDSVALANGSYVDRVDNTTTYTVSDGVITGTIPAGGVIVLCNDGYCDMTTCVVKVADDTDSNISGESKEITLVATDTVSSTYSINGGEEIAYNDGDKLTIGADMQPLDTLTLTLRGENADGNKTCISYIFKKLEPVGDGTVISFVKPESWSDTIFAYVYDETSYSTVKNNAAWPGIEMVNNGDGTYTYTFTEEWLAPLVIFNDRTNQSNGQLEPGAAVIPDKIYTVN